MQKLSINTTLNYSPNFDQNKRKPKEIKFLILHYTGMKKEKDAINKLTNEKSKVSCHYLIKNNGEILNLPAIPIAPFTKKSPPTTSRKIPIMNNRYSI